MAAMALWRGDKGGPGRAGEEPASAGAVSATKRCAELLVDVLVSSRKLCAAAVGSWSMQCDLSCCFLGVKKTTGRKCLPRQSVP